MNSLKQKHILCCIIELDLDRERTACTDWKGAALTLMPPEWEGLEAGEKAGEREQGAEVCSGDRDIEAWGWKEEEGRSEETGIQ